MQAVDRAGVGAAVVTSALGEFAWRIGWGCVAGGLLALIAGVVLLWRSAPVEVGPPSLATPLAVANGRAPVEVGPPSLATPLAVANGRAPGDVGPSN